MDRNRKERLLLKRPTHPPKHLPIIKPPVPLRYGFTFGRWDGRIGDG